jgi:hypothetical protein
VGSGASGPTRQAARLNKKAQLADAAIADRLMAHARARFERSGRSIRAS